jgi:lipopolysaccharide exporter
MVLARALDRSLGFVSTLILARLLVPADFGLVAMATSLIALLEILAYFGLDTALLRHDDATHAQYNAVWTMNALAGCVLSLVMVSLSLPAAHFYREPRITAVICALAAGALIQGFENVGIVDFRKQMRFDREFRFLFGKKLLAFSVTVPMAIWLRNYWALVAGMLVGRSAGVTLSYLLQPFRPRFSLRSVGELMHFSKWLILQNVLSFLKERASDLVIGRLAGPSALGIFSVATEISSMPGTELVAPINRAILPAYMGLAHDLPALRREYVSVMSMVALLAVPAVAGLAACAPFAILLLLGPKWSQTADVIEILAFYGITQVMQSNAYSAFLALGRPQVFVRITSIHVAVLLALLVPLTMTFGLKGAAWAYVVTSAIVMPIDFYFITRFMGLRPAEFIRQLWRPVCAAALMYLGIRTLVPPQAVTGLHAAYSLTACIGLGVPLYAVAILVFWVLSGRPEGSAETWTLNRLRAAVARGLHAWQARGRGASQLKS